MSINLRKLVLDLIENLGVPAAAEKFQVSVNTVKNWRTGSTPSAEAMQIALNEWHGESAQAGPAYEWEGRKVAILMACYKEITVQTHDTLFRNYAKYGAAKLSRLQEHNTLIEDARNALGHRFMTELPKETEYGIFIDDDMVLPVGNAQVYNEKYGMGLPLPFAGYHFLERILSHQKQLVGALYFGRNPDGKAQYAEAFESEVEDMGAHRLVRPGLKPTRWVATGAMCVHRSVFQAIMDNAEEKFPDIIPKRADHPWAFFRRMGPLIGEDVSFCARALACGIQPYVDTALICGHVGPTVYGPNNTQRKYTRSQ
jgi:hypothetical protein